MYNVVVNGTTCFKKFTNFIEITKNFNCVKLYYDVNSLEPFLAFSDFTIHNPGFLGLPDYASRRDVR